MSLTVAIVILAVNAHLLPVDSNKVQNLLGISGADEPFLERNRKRRVKK